LLAVSSCNSGADLGSERSAVASERAAPSAAVRSPPAALQPSTQAGEKARESSPELDAMLRDRPAMATALIGKPELRRWLVQRLAGEGLPVMVKWDPAQPRSKQPAEHIPPAGPGAPALLRIGTELSGNDQLALATFELCNLGYTNDFLATWAKVDAKSLGRDAFAEQMTAIELRALAEFQALARVYQIEPTNRDVMLEAMLAWPTDLPTARRRAKLAGSYDAEAYWRSAWDARKAERRAN
jgi:hypothetical protein